MYLIIDEEQGGLVVGCSDKDLTKCVIGRVEFVESAPDDVVGNYKFIDGELVAND